MQYTTTSKPRSTALVKRQTAPRAPAFKPTVRMLKYSAGIVGVGLWVLGWRLFDSAGLGLIGLCVMGIVAIIIAIIGGGGMGVGNEAASAPAPSPVVSPPPAIYRAWQRMTAEQKAVAWPQLTTDEQIRVMRAAMKEWEKKR